MPNNNNFLIQSIFISIWNLRIDIFPFSLHEEGENERIEAIRAIGKSEFYFVVAALLIGRRLLILNPSGGTVDLAN